MSLNNSAKSLLEQLKDIIHQLKPGDFSQPVDVLSQSTLGQHIRHTLEFFICLMDARNEGRINYDRRKHDQIIETDEKLALSVTDSVIDFLDQQTVDFELVHEANYEMTDSPDVAMQSSFFRELSYNIEHAIHHMALIKVGVAQQFDYVKLPRHFGVASSTVRHRQAAS